LNQSKCGLQASTLLPNQRFRSTASGTPSGSTSLELVAQSSRTQPEQHAPPVQRLRIKYAKRGRARFTSHRDFGRAFERSLRRAAVPMAYSSGYSPHPRISYANAAPTGAASEAEYLEIGLAAICDPDEVRNALDAALPPGLDIVEVIVSPPGALADQLTGSHWQVDLPGLSETALSAAVEAFLSREVVTVQRMTKTGLREFDARAAVIALNAADARLTMTLAHQTPLVRPDDVLAGLRAASPEFDPRDPPILTRLAQGRLDLESGTITEPTR
jgi:radical SAM-linked protein